MFNLSDSISFSRNLAGVGLLAGPLLMALAALIDPAYDDDAALYLAEVADGEGAYLIAGLLGTIGSLVFIAGGLGLIRLLRGPAVSLGQVGAWLLTLGLIGLAPVLAFNGFDIALADAESRESAVAIFDSLEDSAALTVYWVSFFFIGVVLGTLLIALALIRRRIVPVWAPGVLLAALAVGFGGSGAVLAALSFILLAVGFYPLAMIILRMSDRSWAEWLPLEAEGLASVPPADVTGAGGGPASS